MSAVLDRFLKYVSFDTSSDEESGSFPSTAKQLILGKYLADELKNIGLSDAELDENGYVTGHLCATAGHENDPAVGYIAHMDTSPEVSGKDVKPEIVEYSGGDVPLGQSGQAITAAAFPFLSKYVGKHLIVTDGTTLLGADDKAGIAEIFTAVEYLIAHPEIAHGPISVCITPDEEIGSGADRFDLKKFGADWAYTVDGGELPELEYENFNAASARVRINGLNIHPGSAKDQMRNAALIAAEFISMLPAAETPAHTEGYEGFYHVTDLSGCVSEAEVRMIIRDHDREKFEARKAFVLRAAEYLCSKYGSGVVTAEVADTYYNMKEKILPHIHIIEAAERAFEACGERAYAVAIRGGTDGARLSFEGLPCPNLPTGGANFHSIHEFIAVESMEKMVEVLVELMRS